MTRFDFARYISRHEALRALPGPKGERFRELFRHGTLAIEIYQSFPVPDGSLDHAVRTITGGTIQPPADFRWPAARQSMVDGVLASATPERDDRLFPDGGAPASFELVDVIGWRLDDVVQKIRGPGGTRVRLQVLPAGAAPGSPEKTIELIRDKIKLEEQAAKKELLTIPFDGKTYRIGVINVPSFYQDFEAKTSGAKDYRSTTRDVRKLIEELQKNDHIEALRVAFGRAANLDHVDLQPAVPTSFA